MVWVRPRRGPKLASGRRAFHHRANGDSGLVDILGSAYAAAGGGLTWIRAAAVVQQKPPTLTLTCRGPPVVTGLRLCQPVDVAGPSDSGGHQPGRRPPGPVAAGRRLTATMAASRVTDTVSVSLLDWDDVISLNALELTSSSRGWPKVVVLGPAAGSAGRRRLRACAHPWIAITARSSPSRAGSLLDPRTR